MRCPECGYNSFKYSEKCKRCGYPDPADSRDQTRDDVNPFDHIGSRDAGDEFEQEQGFNPLSDSAFDNEYAEQEISPFSSAPQERKYAGSYTAIYKRIKINGSGSSVHHGIAGLYERSAAFLIDITLLLTASFLIISTGFYFLGINLFEDFSELMHLILPAYLIMNVLLSSYMVIAVVMYGRTPGKAIMGLSIITDKGNSLSYWASFTRWVGYYLSALPIMAGFFWAVIDADNQCWHDKLAGTIVIKD